MLKAQHWTALHTKYHKQIAKEGIYNVPDVDDVAAG